MQDRLSEAPAPQREVLTPFQRRMRFQARLIGAHLAKHKLDEAEALVWIGKYAVRFNDLYKKEEHTLLERPWEHDELVEEWLAMLDVEAQH